MRLKQLESIRVVLADPSSKFRKELKEALMKAGMRNILDTGNLGQIQKAVEANCVDLIIADTNLPEGSINDFIHDIRHRAIGSNPFIVTVTMISKPSADLVSNAIDSGTDHIIIKPFEVSALVDQILELTLTRKRFVVTTDYIGPDRRTQKREGSMDVPRIEVPNPLRQRMTGQMRETTVRRSIESVWSTINEQKVERYAYQIEWLLDRIIPEVTLEEKSPDFNKHIKKLMWVANDMSARIKDTNFAHVREMIMTFSNMINGAGDAGISPQDVRLLMKLSELISEAFSRDEDFEQSAERLKRESQERQNAKNTILLDGDLMPTNAQNANPDQSDPNAVKMAS